MIFFFKRLGLAPIFQQVTAPLGNFRGLNRPDLIKCQYQKWYLCSNATGNEQLLLLFSWNFRSSLARSRDLAPKSTRSRSWRTTRTAWPCALSSSTCWTTPLSDRTSSTSWPPRQWSSHSGSSTDQSQEGLENTKDNIPCYVNKVLFYTLLTKL